MSDSRAHDEPPVLRVDGLYSGHRGGLVLQGVDLAVARGEVLAVLGRNGVGKSTLMYTIVGLLRAARGSITFDGTEVTQQRPNNIARLGVALVPQGRRVWTGLTVDEHLRVAASPARSRGRWTIESVLDLLPRLRERRHNRADTLSGGEQQMLAVGRALLGNPRLLLLDEPSEGLAPKIVQSIGDIIQELTGTGLTVLLVEQNLALVAKVAARVVVLDRGVVAHENTVEGFRREAELADRLLGIAAE